jgi:protein-S-isoprenylcysteine O-methyltransferase Ste14
MPSWTLWAGRWEMDSSLMKASAVEFRLRFAIHVVVYILGFWAPWNYWLHLDGTGPNAHLWGRLSALLAKNGAVNIGSAFDLVLAVGILCAITGAWLRIWGSAYLGASVMQDRRMQGETVVADGPYRHVRNPLYLGTFAHTLALTLLMPTSGAVFTIVLIGFFQLRLILAEEPFLSTKLGATYFAYCAKVPRLLPAMRARVAAGGMRPLWAQAVVAEIYMWGVAGSFAVLGWRYNALLLTKCVIVSLGVSLVARAFSIQSKPAS